MLCSRHRFAFKLSSLPCYPARHLSTPSPLSRVYILMGVANARTHTEPCTVYWYKVVKSCGGAHISWEFPLLTARWGSEGRGAACRTTVLKHRSLLFRTTLQKQCGRFFAEGVKCFFGNVHHRQAKTTLELFFQQANSDWMKQLLGIFRRCWLFSGCFPPFDERWRLSFFLLQTLF